VTALIEPGTDASSEAQHSPETRRGRRRASVLGVLERYAVVIILAAITVFFSVYGGSASRFATRANLDLLLGNQTVSTMVALGVIFPLISGNFDLTVASTAGLSSIATAAAMSRFTLPLGLAVLVGVAVGCIVGAFNGAVVAVFRMNSVIATLAGTTVIAGVVQWYTSGSPINSGLSDSLMGFGSGRWLGVPKTALLLGLVCVMVWYALSHTPFGRYLHMVGSNAKAARLNGLRVERVVFLSFVASGALAGVAGVVLLARTGSANPQDGPGMLFPAFTAAFLGTTTIKPGRFNVAGTVVGVFFVAISVSGLTLAGADPWVQPIFNGGALLAAVGCSTLISRRRHPEDV
jgi:ribose transport system permease protein